jgi:hypothetical protein
MSTRPNRVVVANESGVTGRYMEHVGNVVSDVCHELNLPVFADVTAGITSNTGSGHDIPDFILFDVAAEKLRLVGEMKVPWKDGKSGLRARPRPRYGAPQLKRFYTPLRAKFYYCLTPVPNLNIL